MSKKLSIDNLFQEDKKKYLAIVFLTLQFPQENNWLRLYHYRYALQINHGIKSSFQKKITIEFNQMIKEENKNPHSIIKKCFKSRGNLVDHINKLVDIELLKKKFVSGEWKYQLNSDFKEKLFYAYNCEWFRKLTKEVPYDVLGKMRNHIESNFKEELKKYKNPYIVIKN
ncbi:MAG: hypothetical protein FK730_09960 [Asgard group archaeon]|nr:hypothetical protein [Asgard group archaeon]